MRSCPKAKPPQTGAETVSITHHDCVRPRRDRRAPRARGACRHSAACRHGDTEVSFSTHADDSEYERKNGLLSQWEGYAGPDGYCFVFDTSAMARHLGQEMDSRYWVPRSVSTVSKSLLCVARNRAHRIWSHSFAPCSSARCWCPMCCSSPCPTRAKCPFGRSFSP
jgi:hypothetical protein